MIPREPYTFKSLLKDVLKVKFSSTAKRNDTGEGMAFAYAGDSLFEPGLDTSPFQVPNLEKELTMINAAIDNYIKVIVYEERMAKRRAS